MKATYSPEDNKLRLYPDARLDKEEYEKVREAGFRWAGRQKLFVAPMWTPSRYDFLLDMCGSVEDEDTTLEERAIERNEAFEGYQENRAQDAENAHAAVSAISDNIPLGQPILVGHHSEKRARKDAEKIENGMRKAVKMWETSEYWKYRAAGVLRHAERKERPDVRARRIKKLKAEKRKYEKYIKESETRISLWSDERLTLVLAKRIAGFETYNQLDKEEITLEQAVKQSVENHEKTIIFYSRWVEHTGFRIEYETALLDEQGEIDLIAKKPRPKQLPLLNYRQPEGFEIENQYNRGVFNHYPQVEMTRAEYSKIDSSYKGGKLVEGTHRVRIACHSALKGYSVVFLTDSKVHPKPEGGKEVAA